MPDLEFTPDELEALTGTSEKSATPEVDVVAALLGGTPSTRPQSHDAASARTAAMQGEVPQAAAGEEYAWLRAGTLVPEYEALLRRHPPLTERHHPKHGRVLVAAYLEDKRRGVRRNMKVGDVMFFDAEALEEIAPETRALECRVVIKVLAYQVGTRIRFWENRHGSGDVPGRSGTVLVCEAGLRLERPRR